MEREKLGSRLGFILLSAGCAIGIGNVWKFPYVAGQNGGAIFILLYLLFLVILGIPVMTMEFAVGRRAQKSPAKIYKEIVPEKKAWNIHSFFAVAGNYILMMFYTVVAGWMLKYFIDFLMGDFENVNNQIIHEHFDAMLGNTGSLILYTTIIIVIGFSICAIGLQNGLEKITKVMMIALMIIMLILAVNSVFLEGSGEGLKYYLLPNWDHFLAIGPGKVIVAAMNQAFFTLSLGMGGMAIFGSYINKDRALLGESVNVALLDTFVAIVAGLIVIPSCFAFNVEVTAGPSLIFLALPNVFNAMPNGRIWGAFFFLFMTFAAFSTVIAVFENIISSSMDIFNISRKKACLWNMVAMFFLAMPCALGFNVLSNLAPLGAGSTILDLEDFIVSNFILPLGSLVFCIFCTWDFGWGWKNFRNEANTGKGMKVPDWIHSYCKYVLPLIILFIFIMGVL